MNDRRITYAASNFSTAHSPDANRSKPAEDAPASDEQSASPAPASEPPIDQPVEATAAPGSREPTREDTLPEDASPENTAAPAELDGVPSDADQVSLTDISFEAPAVAASGPAAEAPSAEVQADEVDEPAEASATEEADAGIEADETPGAVEADAAADEPDAEGAPRAGLMTASAAPPDHASDTDLPSTKAPAVIPPEEDPETRIDESRLRVALSLRSLPVSPRQFYTRQRANVVSLLGIIAAVGVAGWYYQYVHETEPRVVEVRDKNKPNPVRNAAFIQPGKLTPALFSAPLPKIDRNVLLSLGELEYKLGGDRYTRFLRAGKGDTFSEVLEKARVPIEDARAAIAAMRAVYDPRKLREHQGINVMFGTVGDEQSRFLGLRFDTSFDKVVQVRRQESGEFVSAELKKELDVGYARADGTINASLYQAARQAGAPRSAIIQMIHLFSYAVDFQRDIQKGDKFQILFRVHRDKNGKLVHADEVAYASLTVRGTTHKLYRYKPNKKAPPQYLNEKGEGNRKALMKTPIDGARLTSNFGMRRHPILGYSRMHTGTDFGAPTGTPIYAAGDGTVIMAGWRGGYGRYVRIRHNKEYMTAYAHMSKLHVKKGERVKQGQVIGRVGTSGRSTGPHLHYEVLRDGKFINPATMTLPSRNRLEGKELERFMVTRKKMDTIFAALRENNGTGKLLTVKSDVGSVCRNGIRLDPTDDRPCEE